MKLSLIKLLLVNLFFIILVKNSAQDLSINTRFEKIKVNNDTSFTKDVSISLKYNKDALTYPIFFDYELEEVSNIKVYLKKGKRFKQMKPLLIKEEKVDLDYITSKKVKSVLIPPETEAKVTYSIDCKELMYFTDLPFFSYDNIDSVKYQIIVPETFHFLHNVIYKDSLDYLSIDSLQSDSLTKWSIEAIPLKVKYDPLMFFGIYKNLKMPLMRIVVTPVAYRNQEKKYLNDWYLNKIKTRRGLDEITIQKIDELSSGISDTLEIINILYDYVKSNFKYVAVEIGMGAFVPTHVNEVFINKQGDCKDLSNFLSEALKYKGINSNVALAATFNHICDCDFPSLGSANHVVCIANIKNKSIVLDPTDPIHVPATPVQSLQERSILIINSNGGQYQKIKKFLPEQNVINYEVDLKANSQKRSMEGVFKATYKGISGNFLRHQFLDISKYEIKTIGEKHYETVFGNQSVSDFSVTNKEGEIETEGKLSVRGKIFNDNDSRFLFIDFLPKIIEQETRETLLEGTYLGNTFLKKVKLIITIDEPFESFNPIEHTLKNEGVALDLRITNPSAKTIECNYDFIFDYILIEKDNLSIVNEILKSFKKIINDPIILKNKL